MPHTDRPISAHFTLASSSVKQVNSLDLLSLLDIFSHIDRLDEVHLKSDFGGLKRPTKR